MNSHLTFPYLWCAAQVTIISSAALVVAAFSMKQRPDVAARITSWAALVGLCMTLLIPVSLPGYLGPLTASASMPPNRVPAGPKQDDSARTGSDVDPLRSDAIIGIPLNPATLLSRFTHLKQSTASMLTLHHYVEWCIVLALSAGIALGVMKLALGLILLRSVRRRSQPICDENFQALASALLQDMNCIQPIRLAQSDDVSCAAVIGFFRPMILLSSQWRRWTLDELRTVLAHELAHVIRRDSLWRVVVTVCRLAHFYNPLVRWLADRLVLAQELAADRMAIPNAGGSGTYLRSLSQLALQEDMRPCVWSHGSITPVFSGHIVRRVQMLRATDCKHTRSSRSWPSVVMMALVTLFGLATTAIRGFADAEQEGESRAPVPGDGVAEPTIVKVVSFQASNEPLFQRERIPATEPAFSKHGAMHLNCSALRQTRFWPLLEIALKGGFPESVTKDWDLNGLDSISSDALLFAKAGETANQVGLSTTRQRVKTNQNVEWPAAIQKQYPGAVKGTKDGVDFLEAVDPLLGPHPVRFHEVGPRELAVLVQNPVEAIDLEKWIRPSLEGRQYPWADEWNAVSGGVLAVVMTKLQPEDQAAFERALGADHCLLIYQSVDLLSLGVDIANGSSAMEIKVRLRCKESADPEQVLGATRRLLTLSSQHSEPATEAEIKTRSAIEEQFNQMFVRACASAQTRLIREASNVIECQFRTELSPELLAAFSAETSKPQGAPSTSEAAEQPEKTRR